MPKKKIAQKRKPKALKSLKKVPAKDPLPGNEEPTADEVSSAEKSAKREEEERKSRERIERMMKAKPLWYDHNTGSFWLRVKGRFQAMPSARIKDHLRKNFDDGAFGLQDRRDGPWVDGVKEIDWPFWYAETERSVDYAGPLAGHRIGLYEDAGRRFLVTTEANGVWDELPEPKFPELFGPFVQKLLPGVQWRHFCFWLAIAFRALRNGEFRRGQAVFLCGPRNCGKSLLQLIVTLILGGRPANPIDWLTGVTEFNKDCIGSEMWTFDDPRTTNNYQDREAFGERLKEATNNDLLRARGMYAEASYVRIFRRIMGGLQDTPTHLQRIPPMLEGTSDKVNVYRCQDARSTLDRFIVSEQQQVFDKFGEQVAIGMQDQVGLYKAFVAEIPTIQAWLLRTFKDIPEEWREDRMGVKSWQHPELLEIINSLSPAAHVLSLIDHGHSWGALRGPLTGSANDLFESFREKLSGLAKSPIHLGRLLGEIQRQKPGRIEQQQRGGIAHWIIKAPSLEENDNATEQPKN